MKRHSTNRIRITLLILFSVMLIGNAAAAAPVRVAILPFDMHAEKDLTFLQEGIMDMLGSRIAYQDQVEVISKSETRSALEAVEGFGGESRALLVGGKLKADYVLFGSITMFGESVSIDAKMVDVTGQQPPLPFFTQTRGMGEVIPQINRFATDINETVFGRAAPKRTLAAAPPSTSRAAATQQAPSAPAVDPRMHPEKLLQQGGAVSTAPIPPTPVSPAASGTPNPAFEATAPSAAAAGEDSRTYWRSRNFKALITGLAIADVDNDGNRETIVATERLVSVYRMTNGRLVKVAETAETRASTYAGVDVADVNGNGTPEIYVSSLGPNRESVDSFVLEYDGSAFRTIHGKDNWFYGVADTVDRGTVLLGQRVRAAEESVFTNPIYEMRWQGGNLVPGNRLLPGRTTNLIGLAYGDVLQTGHSVPIGYSEQDRLRIFSTAGETVWEDGDRTGGNMLFYRPPRDDPGVENKEFLPSQVHLADIDQNGKTEVLVALHDEFAKNMLQNLRLFKNARIVCKAWNGASLVSKWQTQEFPGRVSDFVVGDPDNDGQQELMVAVVTKEGSIALTDALSNIIAFELNPQQSN